MSFGLARGRTLDAGFVGRTAADLPALPDSPQEAARARFDPRPWFDDPARPLEIEIGSGKGAFLVRASRLRPDANFLGIEWAREFWLYAADRCRRHDLRNVRLLNADAVEFFAAPAQAAVAKAVTDSVADGVISKKQELLHSS